MIRMRGTFIGMTMDTSRADMTQAVLEGVAFALRDSFEIAKSSASKSTGRRLRRRCKEPSLEKDYCQCVECESGRAGNRKRTRLRAAILAAVACGEYASVEEAAQKLLKSWNTVEPDAELAAKYEERYAQFKQIYPTVKELFGKIEVRHRKEIRSCRFMK